MDGTNLHINGHSVKTVIQNGHHPCYHNHGNTKNTDSEDHYPEKMETEVVLGVIRLDYDYPAAPGDVDHPLSFGYKVIYRVVPGLTYALCKSGALPSDVRDEFITAIKYLEDCGVAAITGDCGFMMWYQDLARNSTHLPVFMSSLMLLPTLVTSLSKQDQVVIMTANGGNLGPMRELLAAECGCNFPSQDNILIVGAQDVPGFEAVVEGKKVDPVKVEPGIVSLAKQTLDQNPRVRAFLIECTEIPPYSNAIRHATGLPVLDVISACNFFISSRRCEERFGRQGWQRKWDGRASEYRYGQNLTAEQKERLVNKAE